MNKTTPLYIRSKASCGLLLLAAAALMSAGCGSEADAIAKLRAISDAAVAAGENQPIFIQMNGDKVGTMMVQGHVDEALPHIATLGKVTEIYFAGTDFDDADVASLTGLSSLRSLVLSDTKITDAGVAELASLPLESISLNGTSITAAAAESISAMSALDTLNISKTKVHEDLTPLATLENLEWLLIAETDLSGLDDASIEVLCNLPKLKRFTATGSNLKAETIDRLKAAKPALSLETGTGADAVEQSPDGSTPVPTG